MKEPLEVVAGIIVHEGRMLACRRAAGRPAAGEWEFPGGKIEAGETAADALEREIREELGVDISAGDELTTDETVVGLRTIRLICLRASLRGHAPTSSTDHDELRWLLPGELWRVAWAAPDVPAVRLLSGTGDPSGTDGARQPLTLTDRLHRSES